ncbi:MAG: hypothetical protein AB1410_10145 [Acidobacteriota bacterium]
MKSKSKETLLNQANKLVGNLGKDPSKQIKWAFNYLRRVKNISSFRNFLNASHASDANQKNWSVAAQKINALTNDYTLDELRDILGWAHRLRRYYYPEKER